MTDALTPFDAKIRDLLMTSEDWEADDVGGCVLLYGPFGNGKSHTAMTASEHPELWPVLVVDTEGSTTGIIKKFDKDKVHVLRPRNVFIDPEDPESELDLYPNTLNLLTAIADGVETSYKTVIIDVADELMNWGVDYYDEIHKGDGYKTYASIHADLTAAPTSKSVGLFKRLKNAGVLVILVVHEKIISSGDGSTAFADFQWAGKGKAILGGIPDAVYYIERNTTPQGRATTTAYSSPTSKNNAKTRYDLPYKITNPTIAQLIGLEPIETAKSSKTKDTK